MQSLLRSLSEKRESIKPVVATCLVSGFLKPKEMLCSNATHSHEKKLLDSQPDMEATAFVSANGILYEGVCAAKI